MPLRLPADRYANIFAHLTHCQLDAHKNISQIFDQSHEHIVVPPSQVFLNHDFEFIFTIGGHLVENDRQFMGLTDFLSQIGETHLVFFENLGATRTNRTIPNHAVFDLTTSFDAVSRSLDKFEPVPFGFLSNHYYVYGQTPSWGIYVCERPTINIIGCLPSFSTGFRSVFNIDGNGLDQLKAFIVKDSSDAFFSKLKSNYVGKNVA